MNYALGCKGPKTDIRDFRCDSTLAGVVNYPTEYKLNPPRVKNQGLVNSCVAHAASSILEYYAGPQVKLSTNFIYGMERSVCGEEQPGMYLIDACKIIHDYGDMLETDCPGNIEVPVVSDLAETVAQDAKKIETASAFKTKSYYKCNTTNDIKFALMNYGPILGCIFWQNKYSLDKDAVVTFGNGTSTDGSGGVSTDGGYHAIMIYGWTEKGWLVQNSWGEDFGNKGRFILPMNYPIAEARIMIDDETLSYQEPAGLVRKSTSSFYKIINKIITLFKFITKTE